VPVFILDDLAAVLVASSRMAGAVPAPDVEAMQALANVAGAALEKAEAFHRERRTATEQTHAALTDDLTALPNRRHAEIILASLHEGDALALLDLDHFHNVNERLGHAGGDAVLRSISEHLSAELRDGDFLARFGGEELLLVLPRRSLADALSAVERLAESWRATRPVTTFSAGVARHIGSDAYGTLSRADAALYAAKHGGRDRCLAEETHLRAV
jgi:diguanylate cyclase (GGDEF)-like protein